MTGTLTVLLALFSLGDSPAAAEPGLSGHWDFEEGSGPTVHDRSGRGNHGRIHGATWVRCGGGHALQFDGRDDFIDCGNDASLNPRGAVTVSAWIRPAVVPAREPGVVGKYFESYALTLYRGGCWWYPRGNESEI